MIRIPKQNKTTLLTYLGIGLVIALMGGLLHFVASPQVLIEYMKYAVLVLFFVNVSYSLWIQKLPVYHPYLMFLGVFALFILVRIGLDALGGGDFAQTTQFCAYVFSVAIQKVLLLIVLLSLFCLQIGAVIATRVIKFDYPPLLKTNDDWTKIALLLFYIGLPFMVYQYLMVGLEIVENGYGARLGDRLTYRNTYLVTFMFRLSFCSFFIYLAGRPKGKYFYLHFLVFLATIYLELLQGARFRVMGISLVALLYIFHYRNVKVNHHFISIILILLITVSAIVGGVRNGGTLSDNKDWFKSFFIEQGIGIQIVGHAVEYEDEIDFTFPMMFARTKMQTDIIAARIRGESFVVDKPTLMHKYGNLPYQLTYYVNEKALKAGWDMSCSYLAELYSIGKMWGIVIGNLLVGFITCIAFNYLSRHRIGLLVLLLVLPFWLFIPRYNTFDFIKDNMTNALFVAFVLFLIYFGKNIYYKVSKKS